MKQLIVSKVSKNANGTFTLSGKDYNYLVNVLRKRVGGVLNLVFDDGDNIGVKTKIKAEITYIDKMAKKLIVSTVDTKVDLESEEKPKSPLPCIFLLQWLIKGTKMDAVVRQATESGVNYILPVYGEFSVVKNENSAKTERRTRIVREARQQSGSEVDTKVFPAMNLDDALLQIEKITAGKIKTSIMFTEKRKAEKNIHQILAKTHDITIIVIGAEGGISMAEEKTLKANGFISCHLNTNILRAETAAIYGIAVVQTLLTEEKIWQLKE